MTARPARPMRERAEASIEIEEKEKWRVFDAEEIDIYIFN